MLHINKKVHSFLYFGINGAWDRLNARLYHGGGEEEKTRNPCLPRNSEFAFSSWIHQNEKGQLLPRSSEQSILYSIKVFNNGDESDFDSCSEVTRRLLRKEVRVNREMYFFSCLFYLFTYLSNHSVSSLFVVVFFRLIWIG